MRAPLKFRVSLGRSRFVRVTVAEDKTGMWRAMKEYSGTRHNHELACTITPGGTEHGCVADVFFNWRALRPSVIAHEASHVADSILDATPPGPGADVGERKAAIIEGLVAKIWIKTQRAPL